MKYFLGGIVVLLAITGMTRLYFNLTDDFRVANITYDLPFAAPWKSAVLSADDNVVIDQILNQKFSYIGKGAQCYAFGSEDGNYVLKFFKFKHLRPSWLAYLLPPGEYKTNYFAIKEKKLKSVFDAYDLAYREDKDNAALIYLHLVPVDGFHKQAIVFDKMGIERKIDLNPTVFLIQRKGVTLRTRLNQLLSEGHVGQAKQSIDQILNMYISEYKKGIYDRDHGVMVNAGFIGNHPFHLDAGKFAKIEKLKDKDLYSEDLALVIWKIEKWIKDAYPEYREELFPFLEERYHAYTGGHYDRLGINLDLFKKRRHLPVLNPSL